MSHLVDIALDESGRLTAMAVELRLTRGSLFLLLESSSADPAAAPVVQAALSAFAGTAACTTATSPARMLDQAFDAANKAVCDVIGRNRSLQGILVSASAVLSTGDTLFVASVGANGVYLRTQGQTRRLADPETPSSRLAVHGLNPDESRNVDNAAVNGLGLPSGVFALRQSRSFPEPDSYLLVLCGAGIDSLITPAHISTTSPATGDMSVTATRLFRQFGDRLMTPSAVLAAHRRASMVESSPFRYSVNGGERPGRRFSGPIPFAILAIAVLGILVYIYLDRSSRQLPPAPVAPPANLLQSGEAPPGTPDSERESDREDGAPLAPGTEPGVLSPEQPLPPPGDLPPGTADAGPVGVTTPTEQPSGQDSGTVSGLGEPAPASPASPAEGDSVAPSASPAVGASASAVKSRGAGPAIPAPGKGRGRPAVGSAGASSAGATGAPGAAKTGAPDSAGASGTSAGEAPGTEGAPAGGGLGAEGLSPDAAPASDEPSGGEASASEEPSPDGLSTVPREDPSAQPAPGDAGAPTSEEPSPATLPLVPGEDPGMQPGPGDAGSTAESTAVGSGPQTGNSAEPEPGSPNAASLDPPVGTSAPTSGAEVQVMDFTQEEKEGQGEPDSPAHRPFPSVRLEPEPLPTGSLGQEEPLVPEG